MKKLTSPILLLVIAFISFSFIKTPVKSKKSARAKAGASAVSRSLAFPVAGRRSNIGSYWGASRDGGRRSHKGIDIFAKKGTPVVAIADGVVTSRGKTPVGGKVLWLKSSKHNWTAYYAHLDKQKVKSGQYVKKGQVIGTVGNTGNARYTPSHLHFGIATSKGWVNPLPYVKNSPKIVASKSATKKKVAKKAKRSKQRSRR
jgi:murein DD-endopeptidase MepM/ murein hydrolase activator NlpD